MYKNSQSIYDYIVFLMPPVGREIARPNYINPTAARNLFNIWKDEENKVGTDKLAKPATFSAHEVEEMEKADLVKQVGDKLEITEKGANVIRVMILGNDTSVFDKDERLLDYQTALSNINTPSVRTAKHDRVVRMASTVVEAESKQKRNRYEDMWWETVLKGK